MTSYITGRIFDEITGLPLQAELSLMNLEDSQ